MRGARAKHWVQRIDFNPPPEAQKQAYGVSLKWWPSSFTGLVIYGEKTNPKQKVRLKMADITMCANEVQK